MTAIATEILVILALLILNGLFAMSEIAVVTARKGRLQQRAEGGDRGARAALQLAHDPAPFLSTIQVGITLIGILAGAFGGAGLARQLAAPLRDLPVAGRHADALALGLVVAAITYASLIIGELVPKRIALGAPERIASLAARPLRLVALVVAPLVHLLTGSASFVLRLLQVKAAPDSGVTEEEIRSLVAQGAASGAVLPEEREVVEAAFRLGDRQADQLMTPRPDVAWLDASHDADRLRAHFVEHRAEHVLVCRESIDNVIGFVRPEELLARVMAGDTIDGPLLQRLARPALFVPSVMPAYRLLGELQRERRQAAVVLDEYGGVVGVVSIDDVLDDLVGDVGGPRDLADPDLVRRDDGSWLVDAQLPIADVERALGVTLVDDERPGFHTIGGFVMRALGRIPRVSEHFSARGFRFEVVDMDGRRIDRVLIAPEAPGAGAPTID